MEDTTDNINEPKETEVVLPKLTVKQQIFIEEYCKHFNATRAALTAGYSETTAHSIGWENLRKPEIKSQVDAIVAAKVMTVDEAMLRLSDFARADFSSFLAIDDDNNVTVDLRSNVAQEKMFLIKKIRQTKRKLGDEIIDVSTEIELHDAKDAVKSMLQMHGKLINRTATDHTNAGKPFDPVNIMFDVKNMTDEQLRQIANSETGVDEEGIS